MNTSYLFGPSAPVTGRSVIVGALLVLAVLALLAVAMVCALTGSGTRRHKRPPWR